MTDPTAAVNFIVYDQETGVIRRYGTCPQGAVHLQPHDNEAVRVTPDVCCDSEWKVSLTTGEVVPIDTNED